MANPVVSLNGEEIELACTLGAAKAVPRLSMMALGMQHGPHSLAVAANGGDLTAIAIAIAACTGRPVSKVEQEVWEAGSANFSMPVSEFYLRLSNGGKELTSEDKETDDRPPKASD